MKYFIYIIMMSLASLPACGQRTRNFPTTLPTEEQNVEWARDIYREVALNHPNNAGLDQTLFHQIMTLAVEQKIPVYDYEISGKEVLSTETRTDMESILRNFSIFYEVEEDGSLILHPEDVPASEVGVYFLKESVYYDNANGSFKTRVKALCPVILRDDYLTEAITKYPMFWVNYEDIEPFLDDVTVYANNSNLARHMTAAEFFNRNLYVGHIYKVANISNRSLSSSYEDEAAMLKEQQRIEGELRQIRINTYKLQAK